MNWLLWAILSAVFAGLTAILAKIGVKDVDSNLAAEQSGPRRGT